MNTTLFSIWVKIGLAVSPLLPIYAALDYSLSKMLVEPSWYHNFWLWCGLLIALGVFLVVFGYKVLKPKNFFTRALVEFLAMVVIAGGGFLMFVVGLVAVDLQERQFNGAGSDPTTAETVGFFYPKVENWLADEEFLPLYRFDER